MLDKDSSIYHIPPHATETLDETQCLLRLQHDVCQHTSFQLEIVVDKSVVKGYFLINLSKLYLLLALKTGVEGDSYQVTRSNTMTVWK